MLASRPRVHAIRRVQEQDFAEFTSHLLRLDRASRRLRFGYTVSDETVRAHAERCRARNAIIYACFENGVIRGVGELHLARYGSDSLELDGSERGGELAFSVEFDWRRRGIGAALAERLLRAARGRYLAPLTLSCSADNDAMLALARKCAFRLSYTSYGVKGHLPTTIPSIASRFQELATSCFEGDIASRTAAAHGDADALSARHASQSGLGFTALASCHAAET